MVLCTCCGAHTAVQTSTHDTDSGRRRRPHPRCRAAPPQVLFVRAVRVRRFETLSKQDFAQFLIVGAICGCIWWQARAAGRGGAGRGGAGRGAPPFIPAALLYSLPPSALCSAQPLLPCRYSLSPACCLP